MKEMICKIELNELAGTWLKRNNTFHQLVTVTRLEKLFYNISVSFSPKKGCSMPSDWEKKVYKYNK